VTSAARPRIDAKARNVARTAARPILMGTLLRCSNGEDVRA
jgi:hypothetical protein